MDVNEYDFCPSNAPDRERNGMKKPKPTVSIADTGPSPPIPHQDDSQRPPLGFTASGKKIGRPRTRPIVEPKLAEEKRSKGSRPIGSGGKYTRYKETFTRMPEEAVPMDADLAVQLERNIGSKIAQYRHSQGYTARDVAKRLGVHASQLSAMELGKRRMTLPVLYRVASILQVSVSELFLADGDQPLTVAFVEKLARGVHAATETLLQERGANTPLTLSIAQDIVELILRTPPFEP